MALANAYVNVYGQLGEVFNRIAEGQAPEKFTVQYLKDLGFTSSNYRAVISLLKALGFLTPEGTPTSRYLDYRNTSRSRRVMGEAVREAYSDLFTIKANPTEDDFELIEGKFRSAHNATANTAKLMANTFYSLLKLADMTPPLVEVATPKVEEPKTVEPNPNSEAREGKNLEYGAKLMTGRPNGPTLHYNIQIHLPATKDVEVFNAIFKSLREHLLD
jgi:hypothetical protein